MGQEQRQRQSAWLKDFLNELKKEGLLINIDLEQAIRKETYGNKIIYTHRMMIVREALGEMNRREIGVYTAAAVIIAVINTSPAP